MLKVLLIIFIIFFVFIKLGGFFMRLFFSGFIKKQEQRGRQTYSQKQYKKPSDGNVNIDYIPSDQRKSKSSGSDYKGGDFVDYEEVK